jgi:hypothetical protein
MTHSKSVALIICVVFVLAGFAVSSAGQVSTQKQPPSVGSKPRPPLIDYNVSGKIGWQEYALLAKKCGDLRVVISEKGTTNKWGLNLTQYDSRLSISNRHPTRTSVTTG